MISDECFSKKCQIANGGVYNGEKVQRLSDASKDVDELIDDFNCRAAHALETAHDTSAIDSVH